MDLQGPADILYNLVNSGLTGSKSFGDVESQVQAAAASAGIPDEVVSEVLDRFREELQPVEPEISVPRLLVDWGELPRVGFQVRPEFSLLCPAYDARPEIHVKVDRDLDHNPDDPLRRPQIDEPGLWTFHVPFRMATDGMDCRPGQYLINVDVSFREAPEKAARFFRCRIRLKVSDLNSGEGGILEIDGDGQSMVNLQGYNLKQFSKVVLKGGADSVINLQDAIGGARPDAWPTEPEKPTTFEYELKVNSEKQSRLPTVLPRNSRPAYLDAMGLFFEDGRRTLLYARPRLTFGRSRDNDVVLRFLPRSVENDADSRNISRTHFVTELMPDGIEIRDESRSGIELNYTVVRDREVIPTGHSGEVTEVKLGVTGTVPQSFTLEMTSFGPDRYTEQDELEFWHELYSEIVGGRLSRLTREAISQRLDAVRFDRVENLAGEESYVMLLREALIGGSPNTSSVVLSEGDGMVCARILHLDRSFWLEPLSSMQLPSIDGQELPLRSLTRLTPGMEISFGGEVAKFDRPGQLYLDN